MQDQLDIQGDTVHVKKSLNTKCGRLLSRHSNKLNSKYKKSHKVSRRGVCKKPPAKQCHTKAMNCTYWWEVEWQRLTVNCNIVKILITSKVCSPLSSKNYYLCMHWINILCRSYYCLMSTRLCYQIHWINTYLKGKVGIYCKIHNLIQILNILLFFILYRNFHWKRLKT